MPRREARALWRGTADRGAGQMAVGSGAFEGRYSYRTRFDDGTDHHTNPEELIGAAHAGCYAMSLGHALGAQGHTPDLIEVRAAVDFEQGRDGFAIQRIRLTADARIPGMEPAAFQQIAERALRNCPVSKALQGVRIELEAHLR